MERDRIAAGEDLQHAPISGQLFADSASGVHGSARKHVYHGDTHILHRTKTDLCSVRGDLLRLRWWVDVAAWV